MKKLLPALLIAFFAVAALVSPVIVSAQQLATGGATSRWVIDPEVTFIGKNAARAGLFLDWTLKNYNWVCVNKVTDRQCDDSNNPIAKYWSLIVLYIVVPLLFVVILATSVVIIVTRGKSLTIMKFIPRFIAVILLIVFSYSLLQFFYQFTDLIQGFFLRSDIAKPCPPDCISQKDLLYVGWDYRTFIGLRLLGDMYAESAFISLLLTKLTALTYFVMVFLLLVRKIILWFFIIVSPIFPILLLYYPVRNTAKIWIGEFFRWMLYAPLFAIFLNGLVYLWKNQIPLVFVNSNIGNASQIVFPTAVNILLGGPRQFVTPTNSVNLIETFALYVVSLIMLWIVILLPWILLQIFLDYASNFAPGDTAVMKTLVNLATSNRQPPPGGGGVGPQPEGTAVALPFAKKFSIPKDLQPTGEAKQITFQGANVKAEFAQTPNFNNANVNANVNANTNINSAQVTAQVLSTASVKIPSMRDIARYDTALISRDQSKQQEVVRITQQLEKIATPVAVTNTVEREKVTEIREKLVESSDKGNVVASTILNAANSVATRTSQVSTEEIKNVLAQIASPASTSSSTTSVVNREKLAKLHDTLQKESKENNNQLAQSILSVSEKSTASEIEKIREQLASSQTQSNTIASSVLSSISSASKQSQNISQLKTVLQQIANPASVTNSVDKERFSKLHEQLSKESSQNNNQLATSILSVSDKTTSSELEKIQTQLSQTQAQNNAVASSVNKAVQNTQVKKVLQQIANPASVTNSVEREKYSKLHNQLSKESKENNNQLASSILSVNDSTSSATLEKIHDQLMQTKESSVSSSVMSTINSAIQQNQSTTHVKSVLQSVANPTAANVVDREKINKLHETLSKASKEGNQLASSILSVSDKTSVADIQKLQEKIQDAKTKGEPLATEVSALTQAQSALPAVNRVQTVSKEDYQAVRDMWKQNYANLEIPQGMAGTRAEWIKDDISTIDQTIALLTSTDQTKVQEGMDQVSNLLPFLMVGGFSKDEIVSYLKAKQDAAKDVSQSLAVEEEDTVSVSTAKAHTEQTMTASMESSSSSSSSDESTFGTGDIVTPQVTTNNFVTPQVSNEILAMVNLKMPKMRDIVRYETHAISTDTNKVADIKKMHSMLANIANPSQAAAGPEREKFVKIREKLLDESQKGNVTAQTLLSAANSTTKTQTAVPAHITVKNVLQQIAAPSTATSEVNKKRFTDLHERLEKASKEGNEVASAILSVKETTSVEDIEKLSSKLKEETQKGEPLATSVLSNVSTPVSLPTSNRVQTVSKEEFEEVKSLWKENYQKLEVPQGMAGTRAEWIKDDIASIDETIGLLTSSDQAKVQEGMDKVSNILPFLMVGGFSQDEIVSYLKAKQDAAKEVSKTLAVEEEETAVSSTTQSHTEHAMSASVSGSSSDESSSFGTGDTQINTTNIINPKISNEILAMVNLKMPKMRDIVRYETHAMSKDETKVADIKKMHSMLANIANPSGVSEGAEREKFVQLREKLLGESQKGNVTAEVILSAANSTTKTQANVPAHITVKSVLQQIAAPATATSEVSKKRFTDLHEKLEKASKEGNDVASSILSVKDTTSVEDIEKLSTKLKEAKQQGEPLATSVLESVSNPVSLPSANRIQTVSKEEFDEVKTLWKENYQNLELPQGMAGTRAEWIKEDISKIDKTVSLLTSKNQEEVTQGLEEVSNILPFLLIGGYSQTEIVSYLQAKQDAAKEILQTISNEEETTINVENKQQTTNQSMTAPSEVTNVENTSMPQSAGNTVTAPQISNEILAMVNLKLPKIQDIAKYESSRARKDTPQLEEVEKTNNVLQKLANPGAISDDSERERFNKLKEQLLEEKQKGNRTAEVVLSAAFGVQKTAPEALKDSLAQIADPSLVKTEKDKKRFDELHEHLKKESEKGNELATEILAAKPTASQEEIEKLSAKLKDAKAKGEPVAKSVLDNLSEGATVPGANSLQPVSDEDYEEVKKMWEENYRTLPVPEEFTNDTQGRIAWINDDIKDILEVIELLTSLDTEKQQQGMDKVSEILPMLLLGGFSKDEIIGYLKAKVEAGTTVVAELQKEEEGKVSVEAAEGLEKVPEEMKAEEGLEKIEDENKDS